MKKTYIYIIILFFIAMQCKQPINNEMSQIDKRFKERFKGPAPTEPEKTEAWSVIPKIIKPVYANKPPSDAVVLFDGQDLDEWVSVKDNTKAKWTINKDKSMSVSKNSGDIKTRRTFGSIQLHIEWRSPKKVVGDNQNRGNSGVYFQDRYEVQILDSYNNKTYPNGQAGSVYKQHTPLVNACKKPGEWQVYDIIFHAPKFDAKGNKIASGRLTVLHNGILIQDHVELFGTTEYIGYPKNEAHGKGSIKLQDHGSPVSYRNIWLREL